MKTKTITITPEYQNKRLDIFLTEYFQKEFSRTYWQKQIKKGYVLVNQEGVSVHYFLQEGDVIRISIPKEKKKSPITTISIPVLFEHPDFLIIQKPSGITVHKPFTDFHETTLIDIIMKKYPEIKTVGDNTLRPGIVHRLDKPVSGLMIIARNQDFFTHIKKQFQEKVVTKKYKALVYGKVAKEQGVIDLPLDTSTHISKVKPKGMQGKEAITHFLVEKKFAAFTLLDIMIETGKTHQIRAHLSFYGHPIVGETVYIPKHFKRKKRMDRLFLHAYYLSFLDRDKKQQIFTCDLPVELQTFLNTLS